MKFVINKRYCILYGYLMYSLYLCSKYCYVLRLFIENLYGNKKKHKCIKYNKLEYQINSD